MLKRLVTALILGILWGCGPKPPAPHPPLPPVPEKYQALSFSDFKKNTGPWWEAFGDPTLNQLVEKLLSQNFDLREQSARIEELVFLFKETRAAEFPALDFSFRGDKQRTVVLAPYFRGGGFITGRLTGSLAAKYEVDLWRKLARATKASRLRLLAEEENRQALAQSLIAELVSKYLEGAFLSCELKVAQKEVRVQESYVRSLSTRYQKGLVEASILEEEKRLLATLKTDLSRLSREIKTRYQQIALLTASYPGEEFFSFGVCSLDLPPPPPGLPSELLLRRPDIRAARAKLLAAAQEAAAQQAARFPSLSLTASKGRISNALNTLLRKRNRFWELAFGVTQPIFDAGKRKAAARAAKARFKAQEVAYARTVLQAFFEVENALLYEGHLRAELALAQAEEEAACREKELKELRYRLGAASVLDYLKAKHFCLERKRKTLEARKTLLLNRVSLYRALGGSWPIPKK